MRTMNYDRLFVEVGECGTYQIISSLLFSIFTFIPAINSLISVYTLMKRDFWCEDWITNTTNASQILNKCHPANLHNMTEEYFYTNCSSWKFKNDVFSSTIISKYLLICEQERLIPLETLSYMTAYLIGCTLWGYLSDRIGRVRSLLCATLITGFSALGVCLSHQYSLYVIMRFVAGFGSSAFLSIGATYISEIMTSKYQTCFVLNIFGNGFPLGCCFLVILAWLTRDSEKLQIINAAFCFLPVIFYPLIQESPRWLLSSDQTEKAFLAYSKIGTINRHRTLNRKMFEEIVATTGLVKIEGSTISLKEKIFAFKEILQHRKVLLLVLLVAYNFLVSCFIYFGLSLGSGKLGGNVFVTLLLMSCLEIVAHALSYFVVHCFGQVPVVIICFLVGGICVSMGSFFYKVPKYEIYLLTFCLIGRFFITAVFTLQFNLTSALFPTSLRNVILGFCITVSRLGTILATVVFMTQKVWIPLPFFIMGGLAVTAAFTNFFFLPEVSGQPLPERIEETERMQPARMQMYRKKEVQIDSFVDNF